MIRIDYSQEPRRDVLCIDVKSFFASVEAASRGLHPLKAYIVVMSKPDIAGGLVLAASPRVKSEYGIKTGSRRFEIPKNSHIQIVEPRMGLYVKTNLRIIEVFKQFVSENDLHIYSIDESFLDVTASRTLFGSADEIAKKIQQTIWDRYRLIVSVGIGDNPLLAKLALDNEAKHCAATRYTAEWRYEDVPHTVWNIHPLTNMWGIGERTARNLQRLGIHTVRQLAQYDVKKLKSSHGVIGEQLFYHAHGIDQSIISEKYTPVSTSYGKSQVLNRDYVIQEETEVVIQEMADQVAARLREHHAECGLVHVSIGYSRDVGGSGFSRQMTVYPTNSSKKIIEVCLHLFRTHYTGLPVRTVAVQCGKVQHRTSWQLDLFEEAEKTISQEKLEHVMDQVRSRYGYTSLVHASSLTRGGTAVNRSGLIGGHKK
ncbi:Y-family DNA polymerase [Atopococcus tabaci]|uniref:Y-family DNA polymerase n=1 Tax=Atopococcus tabaci TaxID=269774 RepID=UPI0030C6F8D0